MGKDSFDVIRKALLWAVTNGMYVEAQVLSYRGGRMMMVADTPKRLKALLRSRSVEVIHACIYDRYRARYVVRNGKVVPMKIWPVTQKLIDKYEKELKKYEQEKKKEPSN